MQSPVLKMSPLLPVTDQRKKLLQCAVADSCSVPIPVYPTFTSEKLAPKMKAQDSMYTAHTNPTYCLEWDRPTTP